jgi:hypothetical protein
MTSTVSPTVWPQSSEDIHIDQEAAELLLDRMSERVTVTGTLVKNPNAQVIYYRHGAVMTPGLISFRYQRDRGSPPLLRRTWSRCRDR